MKQQKGRPKTATLVSQKPLSELFFNCFRQHVSNLAETPGNQYFFNAYDYPAMSIILC